MPHATLVFTLQKEEDRRESEEEEEPRAVNTEKDEVGRRECRTGGRRGRGWRERNNNTVLWTTPERRDGTLPRHLLTDTTRQTPVRS